MSNVPASLKSRWRVSQREELVIGGCGRPWNFLRAGPYAIGGVLELRREARAPEQCSGHRGDVADSDKYTIPRADMGEECRPAMVEERVDGGGCPDGGL